MPVILLLQILFVDGFIFGFLAKKWELGIISFSMQENSMEDVFINSKEGKLFPV